ncbi:MAG: hypothetical protein WD073_05740 [Xanthobacteraceae bacterium]
MRSRQDLIHEDVLKRLSNALDQPVFDEIRLLRNKIVAHAADPMTRPNIVSDITLGKVAEAHRILLQVTQVVSSAILCEGGVGTFPHAQFDHLKDLDAPFVPAKHIQGLETFWDAQETERNTWIFEADKSILGP